MDRACTLHRRTYSAYRSGVAAACAVLLMLGWRLDSPGRFHSIVLVFSGFAIAWVSATFARIVYPPPRKYRGQHGPAP